MIKYLQFDELNLLNRTIDIAIDGFFNVTIYILENNFTITDTEDNLIKVEKNPTKTFMLNPRRIHEIYLDYVDEDLFTKYLHGSHVDTFHVDEIHVGSISIFRR